VDAVTTYTMRWFKISDGHVLLSLVYMIKTKVAFLEGRLLSNQSGQSERFSKSSDWLEKSRPSKKATFVLIM